MVSHESTNIKFIVNGLFTVIDDVGEIGVISIACVWLFYKNFQFSDLEKNIKMNRKIITYLEERINAMKMNIVRIGLLFDTKFDQLENIF